MPGPGGRWRRKEIILYLLCVCRLVQDSDPYNSPMYISTCANAMGIWLIAPNTERVALKW